MNQAEEVEKIRRSNHELMGKLRSDMRNGMLGIGISLLNAGAMVLQSFGSDKWGALGMAMMFTTIAAVFLWFYHKNDKLLKAVKKFDDEIGRGERPSPMKL